MNYSLQVVDRQLSEATATVRERIIRVLHARNFSAFKDLVIEAADGIVTLRGSTRSFYHKQLALTHIRNVAASYTLVDEIVVQNSN